MGRRRMDRALRFFAGFEALIRYRNRMGITLKDMADLSADLAAAYPDAYAEVTEQELKAVEDDKRHGISMATVMYSTMLRASIRVSRPNDFWNEKWADRMNDMMWRRGTANVQKEHGRLLNLPEDAQVTGMYVNFEHQGEKQQIYVKMTRYDEAFEHIRDIMLEHLEGRAARLTDAIGAHKKHFRLLTRK